MPDTSRILVIIGPTASGKSALAIALARLTGAEILSVDSMQVYQQMDIGTAKPSLAEQYEIRHHMVNWLRPDEDFSVARYCQLADEVVASCRQRGVPLIATGGTPLYFKALFFGLFNGPGADLAVRQRLGEFENALLHARLSQVDPVAAARIHVADRRRLIRALEVFELVGKPISSFQTDWENASGPRYQSLWVGLDWDRDELNRRINARVKDMIAAGWVEEVAGLLRHVRPLSKSAAEATGYAELTGYLQDKCSLDEAIEQIKIGTRQLARRQMKWLRRFPNVTWLSGVKGEENVGTVARMWKG